MGSVFYMYLLQLHSPRKWPFVFVFVIISVALIRHHYQKPLGREGFQCTVPHYSVALREVRARTQTEQGQGDRKGPCSVQLTVPRCLLSLLSYTLQDHYYWAGLPYQSSGMKMPPVFIDKPVLQSCFSLRVPPL